MMVNSIGDIQDLVISGFCEWDKLGAVVTREKDSFIIFNYTAAASYENRWNYFEMISRGLIINKVTGEIVGRGYDKFFNWMEGERYTDAKIVSITEKMDGSLGILYRDDGYKIATRGSLESDQAQWATKFLNSNYSFSVPHEWSLLFEIIYPDNRVIIDYGDESNLYLLGIRNRFNGKYLRTSMVETFADKYGFPMPKKYEFVSINEILSEAKTIDANQEGWVVDFADGQKFKFKGEEYRRLHKLLKGLSFKWALENYRNGTIEQAREVLPEEFREELDKWIHEIEIKVIETKEKVESALCHAPQATREDFALWATQSFKDLTPYLFAKLDGKDVEPIILRKEFENHAIGI